jgi:hypothetical protein
MAVYSTCCVKSWCEIMFYFDERLVIADVMKNMFVFNEIEFKLAGLKMKVQ